LLTKLSGTSDLLTVALASTGDILTSDFSSSAATGSATVQDT